MADEITLAVLSERLDSLIRLRTDDHADYQEGKQAARQDMKTVYGRLDLIEQTLVRMEGKLHQPSDCPLANRLNGMERIVSSISVWRWTLTGAIVALSALVGWIMRAVTIRFSGN